ncbi:MAG: recombinase family protein, partial [Caldilineaceae bacterium]|nr:recombinase family protein [Caldilineaceae bacterium]
QLRSGRLSEMATNGKFDVLIVREIDRLSRSLAKQLIVEQELKRQGVEIEYVLGEYPDTPEGNFMRHIRGTVAEYEREKINERAVRGRYNKVKSGSVLVSGYAPFGYNLQKDEKGNFYFEIIESEALTIRMIFDWYICGLSTRKIAYRLSDIGAKSFIDNRPERKNIKKKLKQGQWSSGTVRHILNNETYCGTWYYGKRIGRGSKLRAKEDQVAVEVPPIVSREIWEAAMRQKDKNRSEKKHSSSYDFLLKGLFYCSHCGHKIGCRTSHVNGKVYPYYRCNAYKRELANECDYSNLHHRADEVDKIVWNWVISLLTNPERLDSGLAAYKAEKEQNVEPLRERLELVCDLLTDEKEKQARLLDLYLSGEFEKDVLTDRKSRIESKILALTNEEFEIRAMLEEQTISDNEIEAVKQFGQEIANELELSDKDIEAMRYIINLLDMTVKIGVYENCGRCILIQCGLGSDLLSLTRNATCDSFPCKNPPPIRLRITLAVPAHGHRRSR